LLPAAKKNLIPLNIANFRANPRYEEILRRYPRVPKPPDIEYYNTEAGCTEKDIDEPMLDNMLNLMNGLKAGRRCGAS